MKQQVLHNYRTTAEKQNPKGNAEMPSPVNLLYCYQHTPTSLLPCWHMYSSGPGQVRAKHAEQYLIQANLFQIHLDKERTANIHQASFRVLWQS